MKQQNKLARITFGFMAVTQIVLIQLGVQPQSANAIFAAFAGFIAIQVSRSAGTNVDQDYQITLIATIVAFTIAGIINPAPWITLFSTIIILFTPRINEWLHRAPLIGYSDDEDLEDLYEMLDELDDEEYELQPLSETEEIEGDVEELDDVEELEEIEVIPEKPKKLDMKDILNSKKLNK